MEQLPKIMRDRLAATPPEDHPDPDLLGAFAERSLGERERAQVMEHLARCSDCREVVSLAAPALEPTQTVAGVGTKSVWRSWQVLRWGALAACVVVVGAAVLLRRGEEKGKIEGLASSVHEEYRPAVKSPAQEQPPEAAADKLAALAELGKAPEPKREAAAVPKQATRRDQPAGAGFGRLTARSSQQAPTRSQPAAPPASQAVGAAVLPPLLNKSAGQEKQKDEVEFSSAAKPLNEVVTVEAEAAPSAELDERLRDSKKDMPGKAKAGQVPAASAVGAFAHQAGLDAAQREGDRKALILSRNQPVSRWALSSEGALQRSLDGGQTWERVPVADAAVFHALATVGPEVWVGGAAGLLCHSKDSGAHWIRITPVADGAALTGDITGISFDDPPHGKLTTANGENWITTDGGQSWQKK